MRSCLKHCVAPSFSRVDSRARPLSPSLRDSLHVKVGPHLMRWQALMARYSSTSSLSPIAQGKILPPLSWTSKHLTPFCRSYCRSPHSPCDQPTRSLVLLVVSTRKFVMYHHSRPTQIRFLQVLEIERTYTSVSATRMTRYVSLYPRITSADFTSNAVLCYFFNCCLYLELAEYICLCDNF